MLIRFPSVQNIPSLIDYSHFIFHIKVVKLVYLFSLISQYYTAVLESHIVECYLLVTDGVNSSICCSVSLPLHVIKTVTGQKKR